MNDKTVTIWEHPKAHQGIFGSYNIIGMRYVAPDGDIAWHTTSWPGSDPIHSYWITNGDFRHVTMHYMYQGSDRNLVDVRDIAEVNDAEKKAILEAIQQWEAGASAHSE